MGSLWLPHLAVWLRDGGLDVVEDPGWQTRSRSSGGFDSILALQHHHDASAIGRSGQRAADAHWREHEFRPVGNLNLDRNGVWWVGAAGASNTSGLGGPLSCSNGTIQRDTANRHVISTEAANNGLGEPWGQLEEFVAGTAAIIRGLANDGAYDGYTREFQQVLLDPLHPGDVHAHFQWAPDRKIDPAGPPSPYAVASDKYKRWDMNLFRQDVANYLKQPELPMNYLRRMERMHDSRPGNHQLAPVEQVRLHPGQVRQIPLGFATTHAVRVTVVNAGGGGFVSITGDPGLGDPVVNMWDGKQGDGTLILSTPDGHGYVSTTVSCDVIVDVFGRG